MRSIQLALFGLGTVGAEVARLLALHRAAYRARCGADLRLKWVVVRDRNRPRDIDLADAQITDDPSQVFKDPSVEIGVEVVGGTDFSYRVVSGLLSAGKHVVTANKALLAERGAELFRTAREFNRVIAFEASVGGGIPIIAAVGESLASNQITGLAAILNGTSNYILTAMHEKGVEYHAALATAQSLGFAEADPTLDVDGSDAAQKLAVLSRLAFHTDVDAKRIPRRGIAELDSADVAFAKELGYAIKLLAVAERQERRLHLRVGPTLVPGGHPLATVRGEYNAVRVVGDSVGDAFFCGKGAGGAPTASSVVADVLGIATGRSQCTFASLRLWEEQPAGPPFSQNACSSSRFYFRFTISDRPGVLGQIAAVLGRHEISIASVIQHETAEGGDDAAVPLIIMSHHAEEGAVWAALEETDALAVVRRPTICLHVAD